MREIATDTDKGMLRLSGTGLRPAALNYVGPTAPGALAGPAPERRATLLIHVASGVGTGPTELAAFDSALIAAGVANFNLLVLSSVIPPGSTLVVNEEAVNPPGEWGDRLYVVMAEQRASIPDAQAWAGLGWVQEAAGGRGLFVEHHGSSRTAVEREIQESLEAMTLNRGEMFGPIQMKVAGATCGDSPACALVVAVYRATPWNTSTPLAA
jgi:arginine decarboxylase